MKITKWIAAKDWEELDRAVEEGWELNYDVGHHSEYSVLATKGDYETMKPTAIPKEPDARAQFHLLVDDFIEEMTVVMEVGVEKYQPHDWMLGRDWHEHVDAIKRHLTAWNSQCEDIDRDGFHHLAAVAANAMILWTWQRTGAGNDDRPGTAAERILQRLREEKYGEHYCHSIDGPEIV